MSKNNLIEESFVFRILSPSPFNIAELNEKEYKKMLDWLYKNSIPFTEVVYKSHFFVKDSPMKVGIQNKIAVRAITPLLEEYLTETGIYNRLN